MLPILDGCGSLPKGASADSAAPDAPKGELIYCSFSQTRHGGLGKDYCELIADPGVKPQVKVRMNVGNDIEGEDASRKGDFDVKASVVKDLQGQLAEAKVYTLNGYFLDEQLCGGATYRIYMEYSSGEKVNASWFGHDVKPEAWEAYALIEKFFQPWIKKCSSR